MIYDANGLKNTLGKMQYLNSAKLLPFPRAVSFLYLEQPCMSGAKIRCRQCVLFFTSAYHEYVQILFLTLNGEFH